MTRDQAEEIRVLQERVAQLEASLASGIDPMRRALLEHAEGFLTVVTPEGRMLATGRTSAGFGSVIGRSVFEFTHPDHRGVLRDALERARTARTPVICETVAYGENGEPGHSYITRILPIVEEDEVRAIVLVPTDITDRVRLERSLAESQQALRLAVDAAKIGLWRWDMRTDEIVWDRRTLEIWGADETPKTYEAFLEMIHPDDRARIHGMVQEARTTGVYPVFEHRVARPPPGVPERWILAASSVLKDPDGRPTAIMGGILDVTEQRHLATQLARAGRVESIGQLTAGLAHNFNNLLAVIVPHLEMAQASAAEPLRAGLTVALDAALQARDLVKSLLALARRGPAHSPEPADPKEVAKRVEAICRTTFPREITIDLGIDPGAGHVRMPASDLEQVLLNLMFNARDALERANGRARRIDLSVRRAPLDGAPGLLLQVTDTGAGMTEEVRRRLFEPFFSTKPPHLGAGLGLANAAARVRDAGGRLECASTPGVGTTFTLHLAEVPPPAAGSEASSGGTRAVGPGGPVLVVDDEPMVRAVLRRLLEGDGYTVLEASSAAGARDVLDREGSRVKLIVLDQSMPSETATEALPSLRQRCAAPIVLFTGFPPEARPDVAAVLEKPATAADLRRVLRQVLEG
jgi:PAS domain S-box-containing protein